MDVDGFLIRCKRQTVKKYILILPIYMIQVTVDTKTIYNVYVQMLTNTNI